MFLCDMFTINDKVIEENIYFFITGKVQGIVIFS